ncbi:hypothetical protein [Achromobacter sp. ACM05]|uniref:hypothetical protein n=1 Tax=Achromobacter sp. ACM05 TaxID=2854776 RepID=UPI001C43910A|nr:hypothetical protein [Achromobacter sp. ACM05]MBV7502111.1 hypothetical protein [Achromobacter sp. ACM05]
MTQEAIVISTTPPLPGLKLVQDLNAALETVATDFAGSVDPAAFAGPYMTWADTGNMLIKRRNDANSAWVVEGALLSYGSASLTFKAAPSAASDDVVVQSQTFGVGQTLQDVTASRAIATTYTNSTGKPIVVYVSTTGTTTSSGIVGRINGFDAAYSTRDGSTGSLVLNMVVPAGSTYVVQNIGSITGTIWRELR